MTSAAAAADESGAKYTRRRRRRRRRRPFFVCFVQYLSYCFALLLLKCRAQLLSFLYSCRAIQPLPFSTTGGFAASPTALQRTTRPLFIIQ